MMFIRRYHYLTLWHEKSLANGEARPFAVIVEAPDRRERKIISIGKYLQGDSTTVAGQVLNNFPDVLLERMDKALDEVGGKELVVDVLRREFSWSVFARKRKSVIRWSFTPAIQVAHSIFAREVEKPETPGKVNTFELMLPNPLLAAASS